MSVLKQRLLFLCWGLSTLAANAASAPRNCWDPLVRRVEATRKILKAIDKDEAGDLMDEGKEINIRAVKGKAARAEYFANLRQQKTDATTVIRTTEIGEVPVMKVLWSNSDGSFSISIFDSTGSFLLTSCAGTESSSYEFTDPVVEQFEKKFNRKDVYLTTSIDLDKKIISVKYVSYKDRTTGQAPVIPKFPATFLGIDGVVYKVVVKSGAAQG